MSEHSTFKSLQNRLDTLKNLDVEPSGTGKMDNGLGCVEKLMSAGNTREKAEELCGKHKANVAEMKKRDSLLGKIMSSMGK